MINNGARFIWGGILGIFGCMMLYTNGLFLFFYERCTASKVCMEDMPSSNTSAWLNILLGLLLLWGAMRAIRPSEQPSRLALGLIALICAVYIAVPFLYARGYIGFTWADNMQIVNMVAAGVVLVFAVKKMRE